MLMITVYHTQSIKLWEPLLMAQVKKDQWAASLPPGWSGNSQAMSNQEKLILNYYLTEVSHQLICLPDENRKRVSAGGCMDIIGWTIGNSQSQRRGCTRGGPLASAVTGLRNLVNGPVSTRHFYFSLAMPLCSFFYYFKRLEKIWAFGIGQSSV